MSSHAPITRLMSCSTSRTARPSSASWRRTVANSSVSASLSPDDGSSSSSTRGRLASARPTSTSRARPVGSPSTRSSATSPQAEPLEQLVGDRRRRAAAAAQRWRNSAPARMFSRTVSRREGLEALERAGQAQAGPLVRRAATVTSLPSSARCPRAVACRPHRALNVVVLPAPLGPIRPVTRAGAHLEVDLGHGDVAAEADGELARPRAAAHQPRASTSRGGRARRSAAVRRAARRRARWPGRASTRSSSVNPSSPSRSRSATSAGSPVVGRGRPPRSARTGGWSGRSR